MILGNSNLSGQPGRTPALTGLGSTALWGATVQSILCQGRGPPCSMASASAVSARRPQPRLLFLASCHTTNQCQLLTPKTQPNCLSSRSRS